MKKAFVGSVWDQDLVDLIEKNKNYKLGGTQKIR